MKLPESAASSAITPMSLHLKATEKDATAMLVQGQHHPSYRAPAGGTYLTSKVKTPPTLLLHAVYEISHQRVKHSK